METPLCTQLARGREGEPRRPPFWQKKLKKLGLLIISRSGTRDAAEKLLSFHCPLRKTNGIANDYWQGRVIFGTFGKLSTDCVRETEDGGGVYPGGRGDGWHRFEFQPAPGGLRFLSLTHLVPGFKTCQAGLQPGSRRRTLGELA